MLDEALRRRRNLAFATTSGVILAGLILSAVAPVARGDTWGAVIGGIRPDDRGLILLDGGYLILRSDGGWAAIGPLHDGGARLVPTLAPDGFFSRDRDGGWAAVGFLPDGGEQVTVGAKPPGY
jgi:hypothetical protein